MLALATTTAACAAKVVSLDGTVASPAWPRRPFPASVTVEAFSGQENESRTFQQYWSDSLAQILRDQRVFAGVKYPRRSDDRADLILRGDVQSHWASRGAANFFTWWPGGLVLAPNWYGTRMRFFAEAKVELVDAGTGKPVGEYSASTSHELVHRSATPGPFFGALIIIPNVIKGSLLTWPRAQYKAIVYPVAYAELWQRIAGQIVEERGPVYAAEAQARRERCGERFDLPPAIGQSWEDFHSCQSSYYEPAGRTLTDQGAGFVFVNTEDGSKIYVNEGAIARWEQGKIPAVGARPPR